MKVIMLEEKKLSFLDLPNKVEGSFWITNPLKTSQKLLNIEANNEKWQLVSNKDCYLKIDENPIKETTLISGNFYTYVNNEIESKLYVTDNYDDSVKLYQVPKECKITIGYKDNNISYNIPLMKDNEIVLNKNGINWSMNLNSSSWVYLNNKRVNKENVNLKNGDNLFILGLTITVLGDLILINNPFNRVMINVSGMFAATINDEEFEYENVSETDLYKDDDYFFKTPRIRRFISTYELKIAPPPSKEKDEDMPLLLLLGPMVTMGMTSVVSFLNVIIRVSNGETTFAKSWTTLLMSLAMMTTTMVWPNLRKNYTKKRKKEKEKKRREVYSEYLAKKEKLLSQEASTQKQILIENLLQLKECYDIVINHRRVLWERKCSQKDFLTIRLGVGNVPLDAKIEFSEEEFVLEEDDMKEAAKKVVDTYRTIPSAPVGYSLASQKVTAVMGLEDKLKTFIDNIILQLITFHSYDDLKIVVFTTENSNTDWSYIKKLPHCFSNDKKIRFFSSNEDEEKSISNFLEQTFLNRLELLKNNKVNESNINSMLPYYLILTDDYINIRKLGITDKILKTNGNLGFSFLIKESRLGRLPSECETFINIESENSTILNININNSYQQEFKNEMDDSFDMNACAEVLANIPIEFEFSYRNLPQSLSFLDMQEVGKIEQLNMMNRWRLNDPTKSLRATVGVDDLGNQLFLDLHEKAHGPHGLIAGTTGSGKSEFIITYILSMALNYSPNEVAFILIDYKGGGLAGAFENKKNNVRLPHLAGTITNLDKNELNRTLISIDSELKRRQAMFNAARDELGESTMDIYKYQKFFREKKLSEPIPHLFIVCDEFAELKAQQPDFMDNLISAARIGRSLGVHLILATQKPSGVVNDQIWSNTKFRVCLKVADKADSIEMLKRPDAATITNAGRFYLQVGYDELFLLGQSGWAGAQYVPKNLTTKEIDRSLSFINNIGDVIKTSEFTNEKIKVENLGDELSNVLKYITELSFKEGLSTRQLWLPNISDKVYLKDLVEKYRVQPNKQEVEAILGEYDDPSRQKQGLLTLKLDSEGNTIAYGQSGVGREMFLKTILYSCSILYTTLDINFYIFDFGSESLRIFEKLPHVGDIVFPQEADKISKMFTMISKEIADRKEKFVEYNGDYRTYCKNSGNKVPLYAVIINNYDAFKEMYSNYEDMLTKIARDGSRYGVIVIMTQSSQTGMFNKLMQNFNHKFALDMNTKEEYVNVLGKIGNVYPKDSLGRGLFKRDIAYEFQTATIIDDESIVEYVKKTGDMLSKQNTYIPKKVPVLPQRIALDMIFQESTTLKNVPLGIIKEDLNVSSYNFKTEKGTIVSANEIETLMPIVHNLLVTFNRIKGVVTAIVDCEEIFKAEEATAHGYFSGDLKDVMKALLYFANEKLETFTKEFVIMFCGIEKLRSTVEPNDLNKLIEKIKSYDKTTIIFVDTGFKLKKVAFESWYSGVISGSNGIWVGNGLMDQSVIKVSDMDKRYKDKIDNEFIWVFKNGTGKLVKLVNETELEIYEK